MLISESSSRKSEVSKRFSSSRSGITRLSMRLLYSRNIHLIPESLSEDLELSSENCFAGFSGDIDEVFDIVHGDELTSEWLSGSIEVFEISERVRPWDHRREIGMDRNTWFLEFVFRIGDLAVAELRECNPMTSEASREDTVHHIDSACNPLDEIFGRSDSHEIVRLRGRKVWCKDVHDTIHIFLRFSDGESTDRHSRSIETRDILAWFDSEIIIDHSLHDREESLIRESLPSSDILEFMPLRDAPCCPSVCPIHRRSSIGMSGFATRTLIECHDDIGPERFLDLHDRLGREEMFRAVSMRTKIYTIFSDLDERLRIIRGLSVISSRGVHRSRGILLQSSFQSRISPCVEMTRIIRCSFCTLTQMPLLHLRSKRKYLETPTIREDREGMLHKSMKSSKSAYNFMSWLQIGMIRIDERDPCTRRDELFTSEPLHRRLCPDRHKGRGMDDAMWRRDRTRSSVSLSRLDREGKCRAVHRKSPRNSGDEYREKLRKCETLDTILFLLNFPSLRGRMVNSKKDSYGMTK